MKIVRNLDRNFYHKLYLYIIFLKLIFFYLNNKLNISKKWIILKIY